MKISGRKPIRPSSPVSGPAQPPKVDKAQSPAIERATDVELSESLKEVDHAREILAAMPDMRAERVEEIKPRVDDGSYQVESGKIAKRIVDSSLRESAKKKSAKNS